MTAVGVKQPSPSAGPTCGHCGAEVPPRAGVRRGERTFCCGGCAAAAELLPDGAGVEGATDETAFAWFEDPAFIADHVSKQGPLSSCRLSLDGLRCGSCVAVIERLPATLPGVLNARVRLDRRYIDLVWDEDAVGLARIAARLHEWGYEPSPYVGDAAREARSAEDRRRLVDIGIAGACAGNAMLIAVALYCGAFEGIERGAERLLEIASAVLGLVAVVGPGRTFFRGAVGALRTGRPHMDLPVSFGLTVGTTAGLVNAVRGSGEIYFDSLAALVFFLLVGRYLQFRQLRVAADRVANLKRLVPPTARRVGPDGVVTVVPAEAVAVGDLVEVRAGDVIPVDGVIAAGDSAIDRSLLTGESVAVAAGAGETVEAGCHNVSARLVVEAVAVGDEARVGRLMELVESASAERAPVVELADRIGGWFVTVVTVLAVVTGLAWGVSSGWEAGVERAVALSIVACPCALGLATPLAIAAAQGRAARRGILIQSGAVFEKLSRPGKLWLDKTGTLTSGRPAVVEWVGPTSWQPVVAEVERHVTHPLATALVATYGDLVALGPTVEDVEVSPRGGLTASRGGGRLVIGSPAFVASEGVTRDETWDRFVDDATGRGCTPVLVASGGVVVAGVSLRDQPRPEAADAITALRSRGWEVGILSGDDGRVVADVARAIGVSADDARGGLTPEDKLAIVRDSSDDAVATVMVGDGVNDAAALAAADVGVAVHGGAEVSLRAAPVFLRRPGLDGLIELVDGARRVGRVVRANFGLSLAYNVAAAVAATAGLINPLVAAVLMPISSLTVVSLSFAARTFDAETEPDAA